MFQLDKKKYDLLFYVILIATLALGFAWVFNLVPADKAEYVQGGLLLVGGKLVGLLFSSKGE
jgi:hypothetical protein